MRTAFPEFRGRNGVKGEQTALISDALVCNGAEEMSSSCPLEISMDPPVVVAERMDQHEEPAAIIQNLPS